MRCRNEEVWYGLGVKVRTSLGYDTTAVAPNIVEVEVTGQRCPETERCFPDLVASLEYDAEAVRP